MKRFQFKAVVALALVLAAPAPATAADVIMLPGTGADGAPGAGAGAPAPRHPVAAVGGAAEGGSRAGRVAVGGGAGLDTVNELLAAGALTRGQAAAFRASISRIAVAQANGRPDLAMRARRTFRAVVERFVRNGALSPGVAQQLVEAV